MGHSTDGIMLTYLANVVHVDIQGIVLSRAQRMDLIRSQASMIAERNLLSPKPSGAQLTDKPTYHRSATDDIALDRQPSTVTCADLSPTQQYELRRQSRKSMYSKSREEFFQDKEKYVRPCPDSATCLSRSPSRYLRALLKHEPDRQRIGALLYPHAYSMEDEAELTTEDREISMETEGGGSTTCEEMLPYLIRMATPGKQCYTYRGAEPTADNRCPVCGDSLPVYVLLSNIQVEC